MSHLEKEVSSRMLFLLEIYKFKFRKLVVEEIPFFFFLPVQSVRTVRDVNSFGKLFSCLSLSPGKTIPLPQRNCTPMHRNLKHNRKLLIAISNENSLFSN